MTDYRERVKQELSDLSEKIYRLDMFIQLSDIYLSLPEIEQKLLRQQLVAMMDYASILRTRIANFT